MNSCSQKGLNYNLGYSDQIITGKLSFVKDTCCPNLGMYFSHSTAFSDYNFYKIFKVEVDSILKGDTIDLLMVYDRYDKLPNFKECGDRFILFLKYEQDKPIIERAEIYSTKLKKKVTKKL